VLLLVSLTGERAIYLALELDRSWTEMTGVYDSKVVEAQFASHRLSFAKAPQQLNVIHVSCYTTSSYVIHFKEHLALILRNLLKRQSHKSHKNQKVGLCQDSFKTVKRKEPSAPAPGSVLLFVSEI